MNIPSQTTIDYDAIANQLVSRCRRAAYFLRIQTTGRRTGMRKTAVRTVFDKLAGKGVPVSGNKAVEILHIYSELGLGTVAIRYSQPAIYWNRNIDVIKLGACLQERAQKGRVLRAITSVSKGKSVICVMPSGSLDALISSGLAKHLDLEVWQRT